MTGKRCAVLGLVCMLAALPGMASTSKTAGAHAALAAPGMERAAEFPAGAARLFDEDVLGAPAFQVASSNASLAALLVRNTVMSQSQCDLIYLDFAGTPTVGDTPLTVTFQDASNIPPEFGEPDVIRWWPTGFPGPSFTQVVQTEPNFQYTYEDAGVYTVCMRLRINGEWCPPETQPDGSQNAPFCKPGYIVANDGDQSEQPPTATFDVTDLVRDQEALLPLMDWVPLWNFTMGYGEDDFAPRFLRDFSFRIRGDSRKADDLGYRNRGGPRSSDLLEFAIFEESYDPDEEKNNLLDSQFDRPIITWDSMGNDRFGRADVTVSGGLAPAGYLTSPMTYSVVLAPGGVPLDPFAPVEAGPETDTSISGKSYIIAVRTSALWQTGLTLASDFLSATMVRPGEDFPPRGDDGELLDSYPEFPVETETGYSSSFSVMDVTSTLFDVFHPIFHDAWNRPRFSYTPLHEWTRPRFDASNIALETLGALIIDMRQMTPVATWLPVIGIDLHSTKAVHFDAHESQTQFQGQGFAVRLEGLDKDGAQLQEVNVVITDIGGDPAEPGSGGIDPRDAFWPNSGSFSILDETNFAIGNDLAFNGVWVWEDTNNNGVFDPPTFNEGGGIDIVDDRPLFPLWMFDLDSGNSDWEYVPFPPDGGDPWWKIKLRFAEGTRRDFDTVAEEENIEGYVEKVPDGGLDFSPYTPDYFVVVRGDSGSKDASLLAGTGTAMPMGADFRAFVEPRRFNPLTGVEDGGIYVSSMLSGIGIRWEFDDIEFPWQDDPRWLAFEPWWNQRTVNANSTKPVRYGIEVHDLVSVYESHNFYAWTTNFLHGRAIDLRESGAETLLMQLWGFSTPGAILSSFDQWIDPFGLQQAKFFYDHSVDIGRWYSRRSVTREGITFLLDDGISVGQFAYEQAGFKNTVDMQPAGPRSSVFPNPPLQPSVPDYVTWPGGLDQYEYPRASNWPVEERETRMLTQKVDIESDHVAMLGINVANSPDPFVTEVRRTLNQITVAFWGPDFHPNDLAPLDPNGTSTLSGVLLFEDTDGDGVYLGSPSPDVIGIPVVFDTPVPLVNPAWPAAPEPVDLDGDGEPDDMNGDGVVDSRDHAWVLRLVPQQAWVVPDEDRRRTVEVEIPTAAGGGKSADEQSGERLAPEPVQWSADDLMARGLAKALEPDAEHGGDDLFIAVRFSQQAKRFQQLRAVIPATLPSRAPSSRRAGVQFFPEVKTAPDAFVKSSPEEDPVQDYYGHDMIEVNIPAKITPLTQPFDAITPGGPGIAMLGLDLSTNLPQNTLASGSTNDSGPGTFTVTGAGWTPGAFAGDYLVDANYESFEIVNNTATQLTLLSGEPARGPWRIVREPSFLEQVWLEIYPESLDELLPSRFNPEDDLLPLHIDQEISGVALYRDNDAHPNNRNGVWDPGIDIPILLDAAPEYIGQPGEPTQVRFVFSTPGTDDHPIPRAQQPRHRQWVPDTFGTGRADANWGDDFFVVVRPSTQLAEGDAFSVGIVSWGPNTPSAPDPDNWTNAWRPPNSPLPFEVRDEFVKFLDFPFGTTGLGFVTMLKEPRQRYFFEGAKARAEEEAIGLGYIRSSSTKKVRSNTLVASNTPVGPRTVVIQRTLPVNAQGKTELPNQTLPGQSVTFSVEGQGFGTQPQVVLSGYDVTVSSATDTRFQVTAVVAEGFVPSEPITIIVRNPDSGREAARSDLFTLVEGSAEAGPRITGVSPSSGGSGAFPVEVRGSGFDEAGVAVYFGGAMMAVQSVSSSSIRVGFPVGGLPFTGALDVRVVNMGSGRQAVAVGAFDYQNAPVRPTKVLLCGPAADAAAGAAARWSDALVFLLAGGLLLAFRRRAARKEMK